MLYSRLFSFTDRCVNHRALPRMVRTLNLQRDAVKTNNPLNLTQLKTVSAVFLTLRSSARKVLFLLNCFIMLCTDHKLVYPTSKYGLEFIVTSQFHTRSSFDDPNLIKKPANDFNSRYHLFARRFESVIKVVWGINKIGKPTVKALIKIFHRFFSGVVNTVASQRSRV